MESRAMYRNMLRGILIIVAIAAIFFGGMLFGSKTPVSGFLFNSQNSAPATNANLANFWKVWTLLDEKYPFTDKKPTDQEKIYGAIQGLVASYGDPYTTYFPPEEAKMFNDEVRGTFGGVGMEIDSKDGLLVVIAPVKDSPAERTGVKSGDILLSIGDKNTEDMPIDEAVGIIRGDIGTQVKLRFYRPSTKSEVSVTIKREVIHYPTLETRVSGDTFIIELASFTEDSAALVKTALEEFSKSKQKNLVLDFRNNPGGYLDAAVDISSYFLPQGKVIVRESFGEHQAETTYRSKGTHAISKKYNLTILVNGGSASASEIVAGALAEQGVGTLIGTKTFGKGSVQELVNLPDGSSVKITVAKWLTPNGVSISQQGLMPSIIVEDDSKTDTDEVMDRALQEFKQK
ncbi:MAG: S41 family peptidase [Candidatus Pacebacteria bacterium]|nr:S41 family peptidase [Candidatus Paceibacterota bacterium]